MGKIKQNFTLEFTPTPAARRKTSEKFSFKAKKYIFSHHNSCFLAPSPIICSWLMLCARICYSDRLRLSMWCLQCVRLNVVGDKKEQNFKNIALINTSFLPLARIPNRAFMTLGRRWELEMCWLCRKKFQTETVEEFSWRFYAKRWLSREGVLHNRWFSLR